MMPFSEIGQKEKNIEDVHDFSFILPTVEYHNRIWTWFDFLITLKNDSKRVLLSQAIKQKLHWKARVLEEPPHTDVQEEEDKAKMLLGAKLLAGQEKPAKKGFFGKSSKS
ncbi:protein kiaa0100-like [Plakobranchus ocellatus]|uniref:Protein kiaa0100-like n=1 Tax=Plakobranchus ocellatus TaxID=259542 RepID=A0AAV3YTN7_9GAST|nr:protein kiaa0100-like [Plakobranchus ocellatus]